VNREVFEAGLLAQVAKPTLFHYRYEMRGQDIEQPYTSHVDMDVREVAADGGKAVYFDMFDGANRRQFGPMAAREQSPLVIVFLQRDVTQMANLTGGAGGYFQQQIRRAFTEPADTGPVEVEVDGQKIQATRVVIRPFKDDPNIARFPKFKDKSYEFIVAKEVPGGLYRLATIATDPADGHLILEESVTFAGVQP
jgi:hypothetical protein